MANLVLKTNTAGNDVSLEMLRGNSYCDWRIINAGGNLCMQANWTTAKVNYYDVLKLEYNTGIITTKGRINAPALTITSESAMAHLKFSRNGWNYINAPEGGSLAFAFTNATTLNSSTTQYEMNATGLYPNDNNVFYLGSDTQRWAVVYATSLNGTGATIGANGITSSGQVFITSTNETALTANTGALLIGTASGAHLSLDANEIQAKSSGTATATLNLNPHGGVTQFGGAIYVASTAEASLTSGTGGIRVGSTSGTHLAIDGNEIQAKSSATAASALYLNPHGGTVYANTGSLIIPVRDSNHTSSTAGEIWIVA